MIGLPKIGITLRRAVAAWSLLCAVCVSAATLEPELICDPADFKLAPGESRAVSLDPDAGMTRVSVALDFPRKALSAKKATGTLVFFDTVGRPVYSASLSVAENPTMAGFDEKGLRLRVDSVSPQGDRVLLLENHISKNVNLSGGVNCLSVVNERGRALFSVGGNAMSPAGEVTFGVPVGSVELSVGTEMPIRRFAVWQGKNPADELATGWTVDSLSEYLKTSTDPVEGFWSFLDRDNDPKWAIPGGFYELAVVKSVTESDTYDIVYLSGATVEGRSWFPGMRKGSLHRTIFADHYRLEWTDARFDRDYPECSADLSASNTILTLRFPLHRSSIRFSRRK